jgi:5'-3' exonuclease
MGVNLLPFIDESRLFKAMRSADNNSSQLTVSERKRNLHGDPLIFYKGSKGQLKQGQSGMLTISQKCLIAGLITGVKNTSEAVAMHQFKHPDYACHKAQLLEGASLREREVDDFEIFNVERTLF